MLLLSRNRFNTWAPHKNFKHQGFMERLATSRKATDRHARRFARANPSKLLDRNSRAELMIFAPLRYEMAPMSRGQLWFSRDG
jgi:hypothetical protein